MRPSLLDALNEHATRSHDAPAVRHVTPASSPGFAETVTYGQLARQVAAMATRLARHVAEGEVVLLACPNDVRFTLTFLAALAGGAKAFSVSPELTDAELQAAADHASAVAAVGPESVLAALRGRVRKL